MSCNVAETTATGNINTAFKVGVNILLFLAPFWFLMQSRGIFIGVGGVIAIIGGVGLLPKSWLTVFLKRMLDSCAFLNIDIAATKPYATHHKQLCPLFCIPHKHTQVLQA